MPGVSYVRARADGGPLKGGAPRAVWQTLGADPQTVSARSAAQRLDLGGRASHLVWNPLNGEIVQLIPIVRAACSLGLADPAGSAARLSLMAGLATAGMAREAAGTEVGAEGRVCAQICVVGYDHQPFTGGPMTGLSEIMSWLDSWGIPRRWPAGQPAAAPGQAPVPSRRLWARGGHFGASQVPGLTAAGPGAIEVDLLTGQLGPRLQDRGSGTRGRAPAASPPQQPPDGERDGIGLFLGERPTGIASLTSAY